MEDLLLGIDVGTTYSKAGVVSVDGVERAHGRGPTEWRRVPTGAEIGPRRLVDGALAAAHSALRKAPRGRVLGIGVTGMAETGVLLDASGRPVAPSIAWHDRRGEEEAAELARAIEPEQYAARTGRPIRRLLSVAKVAWLRSHHDGARRGVRWLSVAEWVAAALAGEQVAEPSLAARTGFLDLMARAAWDRVLEWAGVPSDLLPRLCPAGEAAGRAGGDLPELEGAAVTVAGLDHSCAAVGAGAVRPSDVFNSCGTAEAFIRLIDPPAGAAGIGGVVAAGPNVDWHVLPDRLALVSGFESGLALRRALRPGAGNAAVDGAGLRDSPERVLRDARAALAARGAAVLRTIEEIAGPTGRLVVTGGGAQSADAREVKRRALGPFCIPAVKEAGARGAALLGGVAAGVYPSADDLPPVRCERYGDG